MCGISKSEIAARFQALRESCLSALPGTGEKRNRELMDAAQQSISVFFSVYKTLQIIAPPSRHNA